LALSVPPRTSGEALAQAEQNAACHVAYEMCSLNGAQARIRPS